MNSEITLGDIYEQIAERLHQARARFLDNKEEEGRKLFQRASEDFALYRSSLVNYPGFSALEHSFSVTLALVTMDA